VVEIIDGLDLTAMSKSYRGTGSASYHPAPLLGLLIYGYATGVFSSRKLERATHDSVAFRFIAANDHPDHDTIATFRRRFLPTDCGFPALPGWASTNDQAKTRDCRVDTMLV
jgi:transposase